jgi:hypothetical protein
VFLKHRRLKLPVLIQFRGSRFGFGENFADFSPAISRDDPITQLTAKVSCRWRVFHDDLLLLVVEKSSATGQKLKGLSRPDIYRAFLLLQAFHLRRYLFVVLTDFTIRGLLP